VAKFGTCLVAALLTAASASLASASPGVVRAAVSMRAGPGSGFPVVDRIPAGARVEIVGCIEGGAWCDVSVRGERGWVAARALTYLFGERYVYLPDYVAEVPVTPFVLSTYWSFYYVGRPWYHRHAFWNRYWRVHAPTMAHGPAQPGMGSGAPVAGAGAQPARGPGMAAGGIGQPHPTGGTVGMSAPMTSAVRPPVPQSQAGMQSHAVQPAIARSNGPSQGARAQMVGAGGPMGSAPQMSVARQPGAGFAMGMPRGGTGSVRGGGRSGPGGGFHRH